MFASSLRTVIPRKGEMAGATLFERAQALTHIDREEGILLLNQIIREQEVAENDEELINIKEQGILQLGELYKQEGKAKEMADLIKVTRPFLSLISKAKAAKLVRSLVDMFLDMNAGTGIEVMDNFDIPRLFLYFKYFSLDLPSIKRRYNYAKIVLSGRNKRNGHSFDNHSKPA